MIYVYLSNKKDTMLESDFDFFPSIVNKQGFQ